MAYQALNPSFAQEVNDSFARQSIMSLIGAHLTRVDPGVVEITLPFRGDLTQQHGYVHAGVISTIADSACGYAAYSLMPAASEVLSIEFKINLLRPAKGDSFVARAEVIRPGKTVSAVRAEVFAVKDKTEILIASMQATMMCLGKE
ncbi:MAG: thioesterase [Blastocatellia bacterium]|nr:MAG: thioesterase [Blastocatellia bacterium]